MNVQEFLNAMFELVLDGIIPVAGVFLIALIKKGADWVAAKTDIQILDNVVYEVQDALVAAVDATTQTYVNTLKAEGKFDAEAQKIALQKTMETLSATMTEESHQILATIHGDVDAYLMAKVEQYILSQK